GGSRSEPGEGPAPQPAADSRTSRGDGPMLWSRKPPPSVHDRSRVVGIDLTASRLRAVSAGGGHARPLLLEDPAEALLLHVAADRRTPEVGRAGYALCRKLPHAVCSN